MTKTLRLAVLLSGGGSTLANLLQWQSQGALQATVALVISSRPGVRGLDIALQAGIPTQVVDARSYVEADGKTRDWLAMSKELDRILLAGKYDVICMAGFLSRYYFARAFQGKVINIHPSLIPMFCGQGMHGRHVHEAVVAAGVKIAGCTVHFADHSYDTGPIILQRCCPVYSDDTPDMVAARVFQEECQAYPAAINLMAQGKVHLIDSGGVRIDGDREIERYSHNVD